MPFCVWDSSLLKNNHKCDKNGNFSLKFCYGTLVLWKLNVLTIMHNIMQEVASLKPCINLVWVTLLQQQFLLFSDETDKPNIMLC